MFTQSFFDVVTLGDITENTVIIGVGTAILIVFNVYLLGRAYSDTVRASVKHARTGNHEFFYSNQ